jgi:hypothetical protein
MTHCKLQVNNVVMFKILCGVFAAVGLSVAAAAEDPPPFVYRGKLSGAEIVLNVQPQPLVGRTEPDQASGRYFYRHVGMIIPLVKQENGWLAECAQRFQELNCATPTGYWNIAPQANAPAAETLHATWKATPTSLAQDVILKLVRSPSEAKLTSWEKLLGAGKRKLINRVARDSVVVAMLQDVRSGAKVPQLVDGFPTPVMVDFNRKQNEIFIRQSAQRLENLSVGGDESDGKSIQFASRDWLVVGGEEGGYYGGTHPLSGYSAQLYDLQNGKEVEPRTAMFKHLSNSELEKLTDKYGEVAVPRKQLHSKMVVEGLVVKELTRVVSTQTPVKSKLSAKDHWFNGCIEEWIYSGFRDFDGDEEILVIGSKRDDHYKFPFELMPVWRGLAVYTNSTSEAGRRCRGVMLVIPWSKVAPYLTRPLGNAH